MAPRKKKIGSDLEDGFERSLRDAGVTGFERNVRFIPGRRFLADFWFPHLRLALEVDGGLWKPVSGHTSGDGAHRDRERDILAYTKGGILTFRVGTNHIKHKDNLALNWAIDIIQRREEELNVPKSNRIRISRS